MRNESLILLDYNHLFIHSHLILALHQNVLPKPQFDLLFPDFHFHQSRLELAHLAFDDERHHRQIGEYQVEEHVDGWDVEKTRRHTHIVMRRNEYIRQCRILIGERHVDVHARLVLATEYRLDGAGRCNQNAHEKEANETDANGELRASGESRANVVVALTGRVVLAIDVRNEVEQWPQGLQVAQCLVFVVGLQ